MISEDAKRNFSFYNQIVLIFSFIIGIAYLCGYWSVFNLNIFPFLTLLDLLKSFAYPFLLLYVPLFFLQWITTELNLVEYFQKKSKPLSSYLTGPPRSIAKNGMLFAVLVLSLLIIASLIYLGFFLQSYTLKIGLPIILLIALTWLRNVRKKASSEGDLPIFHRYGGTLLLLCLLPFIGYDYGHCKGEAIFKNKEFSYVLFKKSDEDNLYKFLGYMDEHYFFINSDNTKILMEHELDNFEMSHYKMKCSPSLAR